MPYRFKVYDYLVHKPEDFPVAYRYKDEILSLPMFAELTSTHINLIINVISKFMKTYEKIF